MGFFPIGKSKVRPANYLNVKDFGAYGDGVRDDSIAFNKCISSAVAQGKPVYVPNGTYILNALSMNDIDISNNRTFHIFGDGATSVLKRKNNSITGDTQILFRIEAVTNDGESVVVHDLKFDGNARQNPLPNGADPYGWEHCAHMKIYGRGANSQIQNVNLRDLWLTDPVADHIYFSGAPDVNVNTVNISNIYADGRNRTRSDICFTGYVEVVNATNVICDRFECEFNIDTVKEKPMVMNLSNIFCRQQFDIEGASTTVKDKSIIINADNIAALKGWSLNYLSGSISSSVFYTDPVDTKENRMVYMYNFVFRDCIFKSHVINDVNGSKTIGSGITLDSDLSQVVFDSCTFQADHEINEPISGYAITANPVGTNVRDVTIRNSSFDARLKNNIDLNRCGNITLKDNTYSGTGHAIRMFGSGINPLNLTLDGGDFSKCSGKMFHHNSLDNTTLIIQNLTINDINLSSGYSVDNSAFSPNVRINQRVIMIDVPPSDTMQYGGIKGDTLRLRVPVSGQPFEWRAITTHQTACEWIVVGLNGQVGSNNTYVVDVKAFGAKGNGTVDDSIAIQNAINRVVQEKGGTIFFPKGTYKITTAMIFKEISNIYIEGNGATIKGGRHDLFRVQDISHLHIRGLTYDAINAVGGGCRLLRAIKASHVSLIDCHMKNGALSYFLSTYDGVPVDNEKVFWNQFIKLERCTANGEYLVDNITMFQKANNVVIDQCLLEKGTGDAIKFSGGDCENLYIKHNELRYCHDDGIDMFGSGRYLRINDNYIHHIGSYPANLKLSGDAQNQGGSTFKAWFVNNRVENSSLGLGLANGKNILIQGNIFKGNGIDPRDGRTYGHMIRVEESAEDIRFIDNDFIDNHSTSSVLTIGHEPKANEPTNLHTLIKGNRWRGNAAGYLIFVEDATSTINRMIDVEGNLFDGVPNRAIAVQLGIGSLRIHHNRFINGIGSAVRLMTLAQGVKVTINDNTSELNVLNHVNNGTEIEIEERNNSWQGKGSGNTPAIINVKDFGAIGDGIINDKNSIQQAITEAFKRGGGTVFLPSGTYMITNNLILQDNVTLQGENAESTIILKSTAGNVLQLVENTIIPLESLLTVDVKTSSQSVTIADATGLIVGDHVTIRDNTYKYATSGRNQEFNKIVGIEGNVIKLQNALIGSYTVANGATLVKYSPIKNVKIKGITFKNPPTIAGGSVYIRNAYNITMEDCVVVGANDDPSYRVLTSAYVKFFRCEAREGQSTTVGGNGLGFSIGDSHNCVVNHCRSINVRSDAFENNARYCQYTNNWSEGVYLNGFTTGATGCEHILIDSNMFINPSDDGVMIGSNAFFAYDKFITFTNNQIIGAGYSSLWVINAKHVVVANNHFKNGSRIVRSFEVDIEKAENVTVQGNTISLDDVTHDVIGAFYFDYLNNASIIGNTVNSVLTGIEEGLRYRNSNQISITGNSFHGLVSTVINDNGANTDIYVDGNISNTGTLILASGTSLGENFINNKKTKASGSASVADGGIVAHNLTNTPKSIRVSGSVAGEIISVTAITATTFTVAIRTPAGTAGTTQTIYWQAEV